MGTCFSSASRGCRSATSPAPLATTRGRRLAGLVLQGDGDVRRVDEHDVGAADRGDHAVAAHRELAGAALRPDQRVALAVLVLVLDFLLGHPGLLAVAPHDDEDVGRGEHEPGGDGGLEQRRAVPPPRGLQQTRERHPSGGQQHRHQPLDDAVEHQPPTTPVFSSALTPSQSGLRPEHPLEPATRLNCSNCEPELLEVDAALRRADRRATASDHDDQQRPDDRRRCDRGRRPAPRRPLPGPGRTRSRGPRTSWSMAALACPVCTVRAASARRRRRRARR